MTAQRPLPRRLLVTLAVLVGTAGAAAGVTAAASPDDSVAPSTTVVAEPAPVELDSGDTVITCITESGGESIVAIESIDVFPEDAAGSAILAEGSSIVINVGTDDAVDYDSLDEAQKAEIIAEMTKEAQAMAADLDADGIGYTLEADPVTGVEWPVPDFDDMSAIEGDAIFVSGDADECLTTDGEVITEEQMNAEFEQFLNSMSPEERTTFIDEMTADAASMKAELDAAGIPYTVDVDPVTGIEWPCPGDSVDGTDSSDGISFEFGR